jgi:hypothetical protein
MSTTVVLSGGYDDDADHGDVLTYTGQGGKELKEGNKRTTKGQQKDQGLVLVRF